MTTPADQNPLVYPICTECQAPYILRRSIALDRSRWIEAWLWFRDCKHKKAPPKIIDTRRAMRTRTKRTARAKDLT